MSSRHARLGETSALELRLAHAVADARRRTARDMQAGVLQRLAALRVALSGAIGAARDDTLLCGIGRALDSAIDELTDTIACVEPSALSIDGLGAALAACSTQTRLEIHDTLLVRHSARAELCVYYACREALQNVIKHAGRDAQVTLRLFDVRGGISFQMADDGVGFDATQRHRGVGLMGIRERVEAAGGTVAISSVPGDGVVVAGFVPDESPLPLGSRSADGDRAIRRSVVLEMETERRRIMRDLHDGAQQSLVALRVRIGLALEVAPADSADMTILTTVARDLDLAIAELSDLARGLLGTMPARDMVRGSIPISGAA